MEEGVGISLSLVGSEQHNAFGVIPDMLRRVICYCNLERRESVNVERAEVHTASGMKDI